ncbi:TPA: hypothetical protein ACH3X3_001882 [Trebouxia sp. C0006]
MLPSDVLNEPLFFNRQISQPAASSATTKAACPAAAFLTPQQNPLMLSAGIIKLAHLRLASEMSSVLLASSMAHHRQLSPNISLGFRFSRPPADNSFKMLRQASSTLLAPICNFKRPHQSLSVIPALSKSSLWALEGPAHQPAQLGSPLCLQGQLGPASSVAWGVGLGQSASSSVDGQTSGPTLTAYQVFGHQAPIGPERCDLPPTPFANANIGAISG